MKFGRNKSESDDGSTPSTTPKAAGITPTPPPINREPRESIAPRDTAPRETRPTSASAPAQPATQKPAAERNAPAAPTAPKTAPEKTAPATGESARPHSGLTEKNKVRGTRVSGLWVGLVIAAILAVFLLIFIAQNSEDVAIKFLGWEGNVPLAVAMLAGAVVAVLIVAVPGSLRIAQLRRALRKNAKREDKAAH